MLNQDELIQTLKDAYEHRLRQKLEHRTEQLEKLNEAAIGGSPLAILRRLRELDDEER